jgi:elongator complex protein 3
MGIVVREYDASGEKEYFISYENDETILGFCRMRFPAQSLREEITDESALIRELHVYGQAAAVGTQGTIQHTGIGTQLLHKAEDIARQQGKNKMVIISGVGVREYYRKKHNYHNEGPYMVKTL